jgi:hypothetical protein
MLIRLRGTYYPIASPAATVDAFVAPRQWGNSTTRESRARARTAASIAGRIKYRNTEYRKLREIYALGKD